MASYDQSIIQAIVDRAQQVSDPSKRNRYLRAALQTGIVESGLRNLDYGDADSLGWRQERASLYKNPTNVQASVDRFFDEAAQLDRGQRSWELAADVQRPAAQYRGRYRDVASQAAALLKGAGASTAPASGSPTSAADPSAPAAPDQPSFTDPGGSSDFTSSLLASLARPEQQQAATPLQAPGFATGAKMPEGFASLAPNAGPAAEQEEPVSQRLSLLDALRGDEAALGQGQGSGAAEAVSVPIAQQVAGERSSRTKGAGGSGSFSGSGIKELFWQGKDGINIKDGKRVKQGFVSGHEDHVHVAAGPKTVDHLGRLAEDMGLSVRENETFDPVERVHTQGSYHYRDQAIDVSGDPGKMAAFAALVAEYSRTGRV